MLNASKRYSFSNTPETTSHSYSSSYSSTLRALLLLTGNSIPAAHVAARDRNDRLTTLEFVDPYDIPAVVVPGADMRSKIGGFRHWL
jgi:hypothetical protein